MFVEFLDGCLWKSELSLISAMSEKIDKCSELAPTLGSVRRSPLDSCQDNVLSEANHSNCSELSPGCPDM